MCRVSVPRRKIPEVRVFGYLRFHFGNVPLREIDSVFGFVERSELYGGRPFRGRELSDREVVDLYGAGIGILIYVIRAWGGYPDGVAFAVLLMNMSAPTIDYYTQPRAFGHVDK